MFFIPTRTRHKRLPINDFRHAARAAPVRLSVFAWPVLPVASTSTPPDEDRARPNQSVIAAQRRTNPISTQLDRRVAHTGHSCACVPCPSPGSERGPTGRVTVTRLTLNCGAIRLRALNSNGFLNAASSAACGFAVRTSAKPQAAKTVAPRYRPVARRHYTEEVVSQFGCLWCGHLRELPRLLGI